MVELISGALTGISKVLPNVLQKMGSMGVIANTSMNISVRNCESDLMLLFNLGEKTDKLNELKRKITAQLLTPIEFHDVIHIDGHGLSGLENLKDLQIIRVDENKKGMIDLHKMLDEVTSGAVSISIKSKFPQDLIKQMVKIHINKSAGKKNGKLLYYMEVLLNHPSIWSKVYGSISLRDIVFTINIQNMTGVISETMPNDLARHIRFATAAILSSRMSLKERYEKMVKEFGGGSWQLFMSAVSRITHLTSQEIPNHLSSLISIDPSEDFEIVGVQAIPHMSTIERIPLPVYFPDLVSISVRTRLETGTLTRKGKVEIDLVELRKMISQALKEIRPMGKSMKSINLEQIIEKVDIDSQMNLQKAESRDGDLVFD